MSKKFDDFLNNVITFTVIKLGYKFRKKNYFWIQKFFVLVLLKLWQRPLSNFLQLIFLVFLIYVFLLSKNDSIKNLERAILWSGNKSYFLDSRNAEFMSQGHLSWKFKFVLVIQLSQKRILVLFTILRYYLLYEVND